MENQEPESIRRWKNANQFTLDGKAYTLFTHSENCGWPPYRMTERSVELAIADAWIDDHDDIIEIGAVTPYYWPGRIKNIVDPTDKHELVNHRKCLFDVDVSGKNVLCISTLEHVGQNDYGLKEDKHLAIAALEKLTSQANEFLITVPIGWNKHLDAHLFSENNNKKYRRFFLSRGTSGVDNKWIQYENLTGYQCLYGSMTKSFHIFGNSANSVAIIMP